MKIYYPELVNKIELIFIDESSRKFIRPWPSLDFFYMVNQKDFNSPLHIPSNTQLSEFLNKFNETDILPKLGKYKINELIKEPKTIDIDELRNDYGWDWFNWNTKEGEEILQNIKNIYENPSLDINLNSKTLKILGRLKLKDSTDYGKAVEKEINVYLDSEEDSNLNDFSIETQKFINILKDNNKVIIAKNKKILHPDAIFYGEIDYLLMDKDSKKIYICDLKTSASADTVDYWRQVEVYRQMLIELNPKISKMISEETIIININKKKDNYLFYKKKVNDEIKKIVEESFELKKRYLKEIFK